MPVITLSRELGSRGDEVAAAVAQRLNLRLVDREVINRAARAAGAPEVALAEIDELGLLGVKPTPAALREYREKVAEVIGELADAGNVLLVGRGGQAALAGRQGVLHVRIIAPSELRARHVAERCGISLEAAAARVEASDRARSNFLKRHYGVRWDAPELYDLVLNLAHITPQMAAGLICMAGQGL
jgi:cytidylate kinase